MPHARCSGKPRARPAVAVKHPARISAKRNGRRICYNVTIAKQRKTIAKGNKLGGFVVGHARFAKISAVEGILLTEVMEKRAAEADRKGLTAEKYRQTIVRSYRKS